MRAEVRIIDTQSEEIRPADISQTEKEALLAKYGYGQYNSPNIEQSSNDNGLTFEEMCRREEHKMQEQRMREYQKRVGPKPISFDGDYYSNVNYDSDPDTGLSFKISVVSNMKI
jgi:hypothetical protein